MRRSVATLSTSTAQAPTSGASRIGVVLAPGIECTTTESHTQRDLSGITCVSKNRVILFDRLSNEMVLFNKEHYSFSILQLNKPCWALANVDNEFIVATVGNKLQFFAIRSNKLKQCSRHFVCKGRTKGVSVNNGLYALVIEIEQNNNIVILDKKGRTITEISSIGSPEKAIKIPEEIAMDKNGQLLYMCEANSLRVVCVSCKSEVVWISDPTSPTPVCNPVIMGEFLLVVDVNNKLTLFSQHGTLIMTEPLPGDSASRVPCCIACNESERTLYVVHTYNPVIRAYHILC